MATKPDADEPVACSVGVLDGLDLLSNWGGRGGRALAQKRRGRFGKCQFYLSATASIDGPAERGHCFLCRVRGAVEARVDAGSRCLIRLIDWLTKTFSMLGAYLVPKFFLYYSLHRIFKYIHEVLNVVEINN